MTSVPPVDYAVGKAKFIARLLEHLRDIAESEHDLALLSYLLGVALDEARARTGDASANG